MTSRIIRAPLLLAILLIAALDEFILDRIQGLSDFAPVFLYVILCGPFVIASIVIGYVGGLNRNWLVTILVPFVFSGCVYMGGLYDAPEAMRRANEIDWRFVLVFSGAWLLIPAAITRVLYERWWGPRPPGLCQFCGYNLTGLTELRCPECGHGFTPSNDDVQ